PDGQAVRLELTSDPVGCRQGARVSLWILGDEIFGELLRRLAVECRQEGPRQRRRPGDAKRCDEERQTDEQPRPAVEPAVHRSLERARTGPAPLWAGRNGGHPRL